MAHQRSLPRACALLTLALSAWTVQAADGLQIPDTVWSRWQARVSSIGGETPARGMPAAVVGDYFLDRPSWWPTSLGGGVRASTGVITNFYAIQPGLRAGVGGPDGTEALPYVGLGYSRAAGAAGWGLTADVGLVALGAANAWRAGRAVLGGPQNLDDAVRSLRLSPVLQLGVRYSF